MQIERALAAVQFLAVQVHLALSYLLPTVQASQLQQPAFIDHFS
jgi:hypothetical protein